MVATMSPYVADLVKSLTPTSATESHAENVEEILYDMDKLGQEILEAEGDIALVAEKLLGSRHKQSQLLRSFTADQGAFDAFALKSRAFIMAKLLHTFSLLNTAVIANVGNIKPEEALRSLIKVSEAMANISKSAPTQNNTVNVFENALRTFSPEVQDAMKRLMSLPAGALEAGGAVNGDYGDYEDITESGYTPVGGVA